MKGQFIKAGEKFVRLYDINYHTMINKYNAGIQSGKNEMHLQKANL